MHPSRQFPGHFVDHMPSRLHVLLRVMGLLCSPSAGEVSGVPQGVWGYRRAQPGTDRGRGLLWLCDGPVHIFRIPWAFIVYVVSGVAFFAVMASAVRNGMLRVAIRNQQVYKLQ